MDTIIGKSKRKIHDGIIGHKKIRKISQDLSIINNLDQNYVDTEDLTFQSSPSPDSSEIDCTCIKKQNSDSLSLEKFKTSFKANYFEDLKSTKQKSLNSDNITSHYSKPVADMMYKMGYKVSKGLGLEEQGITAPVEYKGRFGRGGIGYSVENDIIHPKNDIIFSIKGKWLVSKIESVTIPQICIKTLPNITDILVQARFVDADIISQLIKSKSLLDIYKDRDDFLSARMRSNPYETIGKGIFQNRAAMKIANIDAMLNYLLTNWSIEYSPIGLSDREFEKTPFYFADLCAGPGGFSEYVLFRLGWRAKGFGFTLRGDCDFKLEEFLAGTPETFEPHYGILRDGDITKNENIVSFQKYVFEVSNRCGVSLVMADGGFSVKGQENDQEILSRQLIMCQIICATSILREGGNFICKTFDLFTSFSFSLLFLIYLAFKRFTILKPCTSRPANSERYLVCNGFRLREGKAVFNLLLEINSKFNEIKLKGGHMSNFLSESTIYPPTFYNYVVSLNNRFAKIQITALKKIHSFIVEVQQKSNFHEKMKSLSLHAWHIPNIPRSTFKSKCCDPNIYFDEFCRQCNLSSSYLQNSSFPNLCVNNLNDLSEIYSWKCVPIYGSRLILISLGRDNIFYWNCQEAPASFVHINSIVNKAFEIPSRTILEVMLVETFSSQFADGRFLGNQIWIMDIFAVSNTIVCDWPRLQRQKLIKQLYQAIHKPLMNYIPIRPILSFELVELPNLFQGLYSNIPSEQTKVLPRLRLMEDSYVPFQGIYFLRNIKHPWISRLSKTYNKNYFFNTKTNVSSFDFPSDASLDVISGLKCRIIWNWKNFRPDLFTLPNKNDQTTCIQGDLRVSNLSDFIKERL